MSLTFSGERHVRQFPCQCCDSTVDRTWAQLSKDGADRAVFYASCYHHAGGGEAYFDIIIGTWAPATSATTSLSAVVGEPSKATTSRCAP